MNLLNRFVLGLIEAAPVVVKWSDEELDNDWTKVDSGTYDAPGYWKRGGVVHLEGYVTGGTPGAGSTLLVTPLPLGYRPAFPRSFPIYSQSETVGITVTIGSLEVSPLGVITIISGTSTPDYMISLDGVFWRVP